MSADTIPASLAEISPGRARRMEATSRRILDAATQLFLEEGFAATSIDKIVERASISKRTLYSRYRSKEQIFVAIMRDQSASIVYDLDIAEYTSGTIADDLYKFGVDLLRVANRPVSVALFRNIAGEAQRFPELTRDLDLFSRVLSIISTILDAEIRKGGVRIDDTHQAATYFFDNLFGTAFHQVIFGTRPPMSEAIIRGRARQATDYFLRTFRA